MNREIELRHLRYFVAVAEELHFGRAALRLNLAQPPLSQQIQKLEEIVGAKLFLRTSRSVSLTLAGHEMLSSARRTLRKVQRDLEQARSVGRGEVGSLHVGFVGSGMLTTLPGIFRAYREAFPRVRLHLHESFTSRVMEGMQDGTLDAGVFRDGDPAAGLQVSTIYTESFVAVLPAGHRLAARKSISPDELREDGFVYYPRSAGTRAYEKPLTMFEEYGFRPQIVQEGTHWLTILSLVGAGLGVSVGPECVRGIASPEVVCVNLRGVKVESHLELALLKEEARPIVQGFARIAGGSGRLHVDEPD